MLEIKPTGFLVINCNDGYPESDAPSLDDIATRVYGMEYVGQQTDECLARGAYDFDLNGWGYEEYLNLFDQQFPIWKKAHDDGAAYDFVIYRQAPSMGCVIADLIRREEIPRGRYLVLIDW